MGHAGLDTAGLTDLKLGQPTHKRGACIDPRAG
jgi:hypothetical protein